MSRVATIERPFEEPRTGTGGALSHTWAMTVRHMRALLRQPWYVGITLIQPVIWLLLFGKLFSSVALVPGFEANSYVQFLAPGVVVMVAMFSAGWSGMGIIEDLDRGVLDRFLVTPVRRSALIGGRLLQGALIIAIQSLVIVGIAIVAGASFSNGVAGAAALILIAALLGAAMAGISNGVALLARKEETLIGTVNMLILPLSFLSATFMPADLMPGWMRSAARLNPVHWAVEAGRAATTAGTDWAFVGVRVGGLALLAGLCTMFATRAFRSYQRSV
jgi:ABC-2 type transport system permease protein